jgi:AraC-like DNA-binding protein
MMNSPTTPAQSEMQSWTARVEGVVRDHERPLDLDASSIAEQLRVSVRALRRRLDGEGAGLSAILGQVCFERARQQLAHSPCSIRDLADQLGYSEVSSFHRAFKRRAGVTPGEYRARLAL